jgi:hypothetical protein
VIVDREYKIGYRGQSAIYKMHRIKNIGQKKVLERMEENKGYRTEHT